MSYLTVCDLVLESSNVNHCEHPARSFIQALIDLTEGLISQLRISRDDGLTIWEIPALTILGLGLVEVCICDSSQMTHRQH